MKRGAPSGLKTPLESGPRGCKLIMFWMLWLAGVLLHLTSVCS